MELDALHELRLHKLLYKGMFEPEKANNGYVKHMVGKFAKRLQKPSA